MTGDIVMPCRDAGPLYGDGRITSYLPEDVAELQKRLDAATAVAREAMTLIYDDGRTGAVSTFACKWYANHLEEDAKRLENARKSALAKLTDYEKEVLGLK